MDYPYHAEESFLPDPVHLADTMRACTNSPDFMDTTMCHSCRISNPHRRGHLPPMHHYPSHNGPSGLPWTNHLAPRPRSPRSPPSHPELVPPHRRRPQQMKNSHPPPHGSMPLPPMQGGWNSNQMYYFPGSPRRSSVSSVGYRGMEMPYPNDSIPLGRHGSMVCPSQMLPGSCPSDFTDDEYRTEGLHMKRSPSFAAIIPRSFQDVHRKQSMGLVAQDSVEMIPTFERRSSLLFQDYPTYPSSYHAQDAPDMRSGNGYHSGINPQNTINNGGFYNSQSSIENMNGSSTPLPKSSQRWSQHCTDEPRDLTFILGSSTYKLSLSSVQDSSDALVADHEDIHNILCLKGGRCQKVEGHNWKSCAKSHGKERCRRNPARHVYAFTYCTQFDKNNKDWVCTRKDECGYAHSKEEELYHPLRYRTKPCVYGKDKCVNSFCAFYHGLPSPIVERHGLKSLLMALTEITNVNPFMTGEKTIVLEKEEATEFIHILGGTAPHPSEEQCDDYSRKYIRVWLAGYFEKNFTTVSIPQNSMGSSQAPSFGFTLDVHNPTGGQDQRQFVAMDEYFLAKAELILGPSNRRSSPRRLSTQINGSPVDVEAQ